MIFKLYPTTLSQIVYVIETLPEATPVTKPEELTLAKLKLDEDQVPPVKAFDNCKVPSTDNEVAEPVAVISGILPTT